MKYPIKKVLSIVSAISAAAFSLNVLNVSADVIPNPVISRNCPVYSDTAGQPTAANDEHYFSFCFITTPGYLAYDLSAVPEAERKQIIAVWYNTSSYDNIGNYKNRNMEPSDYTIEVNSAPGGEYPTDGWKSLKQFRATPLVHVSILSIWKDITGFALISLRQTIPAENRQALTLIFTTFPKECPTAGFFGRLHYSRGHEQLLRHRLCRTHQHH